MAGRRAEPACNRARGGRPGAAARSAPPPACSPGSAASPEDLVLLEDPADSELCRRLAAAIPDTLAVGGPGAPFFTAFYEVGNVYVTPIVPRVTPAEMDAEARGETILWKEGVTLVFDRDLETLLATPN